MLNRERGLFGTVTVIMQIYTPAALSLWHTNGLHVYKHTLYKLKIL